MKKKTNVNYNFKQHSGHIYWISNCYVILSGKNVLKSYIKKAVTQRTVILLIKTMTMFVTKKIKQNKLKK